MVKSFGALILASLAAPTAMSSPWVNLAWSDVTFVTESGCRVHAHDDREGRIERLEVTCGKKHMRVPKEAYALITGAALHEVRLWEEPGYDTLHLDVPAYEYDKESGNVVSRRVWTFAFRNAAFETSKSGPSKSEPAR